MLKTHSRFFENLLFMFDLVMIATAWLAAYGLRRSGWPIPVYYGMPPLSSYLTYLILIPFIWGIVFKSMRMYRPRRVNRDMTEYKDIIKSSTLGTLLLLASGYLLTKFDVSRLVFGYFWIMSTAGLILSRLIFRALLRVLRRRGYNLRHILILGTEQIGRDFLDQVRCHPELGLSTVGFLSRYPHEIGQQIDGVRVLGRVDDVQRYVRVHDIDQVYIILPVEAMPTLDKTLQQLSCEMVEIKIIPDFSQQIMLRGSFEEFEHLPIVTLIGSPMYGWNCVVKRSLDLCIAGVLLVLCAPLLGLAALLIKVTSRGPVFYRQERMGCDGLRFRIIKFRTMHLDAEGDTGAVWAQPHDPRRTRFGALLRRTSMDELPQLWNVLKGEMSLVGPRPERPVWVDEFRHRIPQYMLRHRVKAGMTGWAQVNGWRGHTSIERRIEHDLYYIQHWSLAFDLKILWLTVRHGLINSNAY